MMMVEEKPEYMITTEKLEELKGHIPRAGPKYRLGMYFETIHNLPSFDEIRHCEEEDKGYTSYWETDTEVDSDFGNFIFNNVHGDSASVICLEDMDLNDLRQRHEDTVARARPHYKLQQSCSSASSPTEHPLEQSLESKHSINSRCSGFRSAMSPPPVPPPRRPSVTDPQDHTYETLDDCRDNYLAHQEVAYISKASDNSRGSQDSGAKPVSPDEGDLNHSSRGAEGAKVKSPTCGKPRSSSLQLPKSPECVNYRQQRKLSEGSTTHVSTSTPRKRRQEKVGSKGTNHPPPIKGFPAGVSDEYADCIATSTGLSSDRRSPMCSAPSPASSPSQRGLTNSTESQRVKKAAPLVIKHKGKTYLVPVVDNKLQKELEKRSKAENPSVLMKQSSFNSGSGASRSLNRRSFASPPKVDALDQAAPPHRRRNNSLKNSPQKTPAKQVTHYGML